VSLLKWKISFLFFILVTSLFLLANLNNNILDKDFLLIAHRGASGCAPEHTMESYKLAKEMNADYLEIDLQISKDNTLVAMHDSTVDRTTNGTGRVDSLTIDELKKLDAGSWFDQSFNQSTIPTLEEVLDEFGHDVNYYIEVKAENGIEKLLLTLLDDYDLLDNYGQVIIQSFHVDSLKLINKLNKKIPLIQLGSIEDFSSKEKLEYISNYAIGIGLNYKDIDKNYTEEVKNHNLKLHPFIVNNTEDIELLIEMGVDGVFTDFLDAYTP